MNTGQYISGALHIGLIGWVLVGDVFRSEPPEPVVTDVSVISTAEFEALIASETPPDVMTDMQNLSFQAVEEEVVEQEQIEDVAPEFEVPDDPEPPIEEESPEFEDVQPVQVQDLLTEIPEMSVPSFQTGPDIKIDESEEAKPRDADRVAPVPFLRPELDVAVWQEVTEAAAEQEVADEVVEEQQEDAAPEEATTEIVTEAEKPSGAPGAVPIPRLRPQRTASEETTQAQQSATEAALFEALASDDAPVEEQEIPSGPPLTFSETEALRVSVSNCWNTGSLSSAALRVTVVVGVRLEESGKPVSASIELLSSTGGSGEAVTQAFEAARRAILRCGTTGYDLPAEKYGQWRDIEMTFNPEKMRIK